MGVRDNPARMLWETVSAKRMLPLVSIDTPLGLRRVAWRDRTGQDRTGQYR